MHDVRQKEDIMNPPTLLSVDALAKFLLDQHGTDLFGGAPPVDVDMVARLLGIEVSEEPRLGAHEIDIVGAITLGSDTEPSKVWINPLENSYSPRRRFTLAHEIAHFCMHRVSNHTGFVDTKRTMNRTMSYWDRFESEANNFAAELLMPENLIRKIGREVINDYKVERSVDKMPLAEFTSRMASKFKVSNPAMEFRLKNVGIRGS